MQRYTSRGSHPLSNSPGREDWGSSSGGG
jgi:hypothetical protein